MKRNLFVLLWVILFFVGGASAQQPGAATGQPTTANTFRPTATPPSPPCPFYRMFLNTSFQMAKVDCLGNVTIIEGGGGGGSGTVTSVSVGNLSPLFTSSVTNPTVAASISFALTAQTANRVFAGPETGGAATPTFRALVPADIPTLPAYQPGGVANSLQANNGGGLFDGGANALLDLTSSTITLGTSSLQNGRIQLRNSSNGNVTNLIAGAPAANITVTIPSVLPASGNECLRISSTGVISSTTGADCGAGGGGGTVTTVGFTGGLISVANPTTTPAFTVAGTSGGVPYFSSASTWASSAALTANLPVIGGGAGNPPTVGTRSGNTTAFATVSGAMTNGRLAAIDASGNFVASGITATTFSPGGITNSIQVNGGGGLPDGSATVLADLASSTIILGDPSVQDGRIQFRNSSNAFVTSLIGGSPAANITIKLFDTLPASDGCLQVDNLGVITQTGSACGSGGGGTGANPTASVGLSAVNGVATTFLRSDGAPALDQGIAPTWTGIHTFTNGVTTGTTSTSGTVHNYNALTTGTGFYIGSTSTAGSSTTSAVFDISRSGAQTGTVTTTAARIANTATGASATNVALTLTASGATTANTALNVTAGQSVFPVGTTALPAVAIGAATNGFIGPSGNQLYGVQGGTIGWGGGNATFSLRSVMVFGFSSGDPSVNAMDTVMRRAAAANLAFGAANAASPVNQTISTQGSRGGTDSNVSGANLTIQSGLGTGNSTPSSLILQSPLIGSTGTTAQTAVTGLTIINGTARLTNYTVATLPGASTAGSGALAYVTDATVTTSLTVVAGGGSNKVSVISDGTNWLIDSGDSPGGGGATTALNNLASVAINTSLLSDTDNTDDLGSSAKRWKDLYLADSIRDGSGNKFLTVSATASAVNAFTITNAATGTGPTLSATGTDSNVDFNILAKGDAFTTVTSDYSTTNSSETVFKVVRNSTGTVADGIGANISFGIETSTTPGFVAGKINTILVGATHLSRNSRMSLETVDNLQALGERASFDHNGMRLPEISSAGAPASNFVYLYAKDNGSGVSKLYYKGDDNTEVGPLAAGGGGSPAGSTGDYQINSGGSFAAGTIAQGSTGRITITPTLQSSGAAAYFRVITPADTTQTASTEAIGMQHGGNTSAATVSRQWAAGTIALQRENLFVAPTYAFASSSTITEALNIEAASPIVGTNATYTAAYAARFIASAAAHTPLIAKGAGSQSADLFKAVSSSNGNLFRVDNTGSIYTQAIFNISATATRIEFSTGNHTIKNFLNGVNYLYLDGTGGTKLAYIGNGDISATPVNGILQGTGGSGTNIAGGTVFVNGGRGTGSAAGGDVNVQVTAPGSSGTGLNSQITVLQVRGNANSDVNINYGLTLSAHSPAQITSDQNNYAPGNAKYFQRWNTDASRQITGLSVGQSTNQVLEIWNVGSFDIVLVHQSGSSLAANRFMNSSAANYTLTPNQGAKLIYDGTDSVWRVHLLQ